MTSNANLLVVLSALIRAALVIFAIGAAIALLVPAYIMLSEVSYTVGAVGGILGPGVLLGTAINLLAALACVVLVPLWTYVGQSNLWEAQLPSLSYRPGWTAAAWFIPFVNLVVPYGAMKELYNRSLGENEYQSADGIGMVTSWWTFAIAYLVVNVITIATLILPVLTGIIVTMPALGQAGQILLLSIFQLGAAFYLFRIVTAITRAQLAGLHLSQASTFA